MSQVKVKFPQNHQILFWLGILGLAFYVIGPLLFPGASIRQPELLPVYTLMMGLGQLMKGKEEDGEDDNDDD